MKRLLLAFLTLAATSTFAAEATNTNRYVVMTRQAPTSVRMRLIVDGEEARRHDVRTFRNINAFGATLTDEEVAELRASGEVLSVEPVQMRYASALPATTRSTASPFGPQLIPWGLDAIRAREVWPVTRGSKTVNVALLDTGIDDTHPDIKHAIAGQFNVYDKTNRAYDDNGVGHGTHVAGTIAAADNAIGIVGIAPDTNIWAVKVLTKNGDGTDEAVSLGLDYVISKKQELGGAWVVNFSLGAPRPSEVEKAGVDKALAAGVIIISAAGNRGVPAVDYPAGYPGVIAIGAMNNKLQVPDFASFGTGLALVAPGVDLPSTVPLGRSKVADIDIEGSTVSAFGTNGSPFATITAPLIYCGFGRPEDFPSNIAGKIAIIERGANLYFGQKSKYAKQAGAIAVILVNDDDDVHPEFYGWNLKAEICDAVDGCHVVPELDGFEFPLTVSVSHADGMPLIAKAGRSVLTVSSRAEDYAILGGTSMAAPHATGTAALLLALDPTLTASQLEFALIATSKDMAATGWDAKYGYGILDALTAAQYVAPQRFGLTDPPKPRPTPRRRPSTH